MKLRQAPYNGLLICLFLFCSCSNTKYLANGDTLYVGSSVKVQDKEVPKSERKQIAKDLQNAIRPIPNKKTLGMRLKLSIYNLAGEPKKPKGFRNWLRTKAGEPPVLGSQFNMETNRKILTNMLENRGFFYPEVAGNITTKKKKTSAEFRVSTGKQYTMRKIESLTDSTKVESAVNYLGGSTLLHAGDPYNLDLIKAERERIDRQMKERGFYFFKPDYILVQVDSTVGNNQVDVFITVKPGLPEEAREDYNINNVFIYPQYRSGGRRKRRGPDNNLTITDSTKSPDDVLARNLDTIFYERYYIIGNKKRGKDVYKPYVFTQAMQFKPGEIYKRSEQNISLNRLINMGTFKFVKNDFKIAGSNKLDAFYYLTPYAKKALRAEIGGLTKSDSRVGSQISLSWRNRNTFRGAELFAIKGSAGFETQYGGQIKRPNTYQFSLEPSLTIPRFVVPFMQPSASSMFVPRTMIKTGYDLVVRSGLYRLHSLKGGYGFAWKEDIRKEHQLFPINITYVRTDTLNRDTTLGINYSNLIFNGIIIGPTYQYTYNSRGDGPPHHDDFYFDGLADLSGNLLGLAEGANVVGGDAPKTILGSAYAQYLKFQADFRHYINYGIDPSAIWVNRILIGYGIPYGNSTRLPNVKQFFSGGNSSLRGFPSRLLGPGTFYYQNANQSSQKFIETSGDIKLELNSELRTPIYNFIHGAVFVDAGNIWTYRESTLFPGGEFKTDKFLEQIAFSTGLGLRFDFKILVLRLDLGMPLKKPWLPAGERWVFDKIEFSDPTWKKQNLVLNLGIGYPF